MIDGFMPRLGVASRRVGVGFGTVVSRIMTVSGLKSDRYRDRMTTIFEILEESVYYKRV